MNAGVIILIVLGVIILLAGLGVGLYFLLRKKPAPSNGLPPGAPTNAAPPKNPVTEFSIQNNAVNDPFPFFKDAVLANLPNRPITQDFPPNLIVQTAPYDCNTAIFVPANYRTLSGEVWEDVLVWRASLPEDFSISGATGATGPVVPTVVAQDAYGQTGPALVTLYVDTADQIGEGTYVTIGGKGQNVKQASQWQFLPLINLPNVGSWILKNNQTFQMVNTTSLNLNSVCQYVKISTDRSQAFSNLPAVTPPTCQVSGSNPNPPIIASC